MLLPDVSPQAHSASAIQTSQTYWCRNEASEVLSIRVHNLDASARLTDAHDFMRSLFR